MKKIVFFLFMWSGVAMAQEFQLSVGAGDTYGGVGARYWIPITNDVRVFVGFGANGGSQYSGAVLECDAGIEAALTNSRRHAVNVFVIAKDETKRDYYDSRSVGIGYSYYLNGMGNTGWSWGVDIVREVYINGQDDDRFSKSYLAVNASYHF